MDEVRRSLSVLRGPGITALVTPAKAGVQFCLRLRRRWIPAFAGMTERGIRGRPFSFLSLVGRSDDATQRGGLLRVGAGAGKFKGELITSIRPI